MRIGEDPLASVADWRAETEEGDGGGFWPGTAGTNGTEEAVAACDRRCGC